MADYRITCTRQERNGVPDHDGHIVAVGVLQDGHVKVLQAEVVYQLLRRGWHTFHTVSLSGVRAEVDLRRRKCGHYDFIATRPDGVRSNNLDELPLCG